MKIILTSDGLSSKKLKDQFVDLLDKPIKEIKMLVVVGLETKEYMKFVNGVVSELTPLGINRQNIFVVNISKKVDFSKLLDIDVVYLLGGSTFYILENLRKNKFDEFIQKWKGKNKIFMGISAGSIIAGPNIKIAEWGSEADDNYVHLKDLKGLGLVKMAIYPHYEDRLKKEIDDFKKIVQYPVETLKDGEGLVVINDKIRRIK
jgi:dipeptidase E